MKITKKPSNKLSIKLKYSDYESLCIFIYKLSCEIQYRAKLETEKDVIDRIYHATIIELQLRLQKATTYPINNVSRKQEKVSVSLTMAEAAVLFFFIDKLDVKLPLLPLLGMHLHKHLL